KRSSARPEWTPDARWIVFSSARAGSRTLWRIPAAGGTPEPVTTGAGGDHEPGVSGDGKRLIYTNVRNTWNLMLLDPKNSQRQELLGRRTDMVFPRFSPAGDRIAFFHVVEEGAHIFTVGLDGSDLRQVTRGKGEINIMPQRSAEAASLYFHQMRPTTTFREGRAAGGPCRAVSWLDRGV